MNDIWSKLVDKFKISFSHKLSLEFVRLNMFVHMCFLFKRLTAQGADKRPLSGVYAPMCSQIMFGGEGFVAHVTRVGVSILDIH